MKLIAGQVSNLGSLSRWPPLAAVTVWEAPSDGLWANRYRKSRVIMMAGLRLPSIRYVTRGVRPGNVAKKGMIPGILPS